MLLDGAAASYATAARLLKKKGSDNKVPTLPI
jgi:hypothetical protein